MPRVLRLITRLNIGGPAIQALLLTHELSDLFPTVLGAGRAPPKEGELSHPDVFVQLVPFVRAIRPLLDLAAGRAVRRLMEQHEPAIVHTHMAKAGAIGRLVASRAVSRPKIVHTFHGHVLEGYFGALKSRAFIQVERYLAKRTDVLVAVSSEIRNDLLGLGIGRPEQWRVIPLGFDLSEFASVSERKGSLRDQLSLSDDTPLVGVLGRLAPVKDHLLLFEALSHLPDVHLVVLGDGEERRRLAARAAAVDLAGRVHMLGWRQDVPDVLSDVDIVALTSINEGTPVTLIEALAAARPVVATDVGGVRSVVDDGVDGLLVRERTPKGVANAIEQLVNDARLRSEMGTLGRQRMLERFSKDELLRNVSALYDELLSARRTSSSQ